MANFTSFYLDTPLSSLASQARKRRNAYFGSRITYSPKVFVPLTMLCRDRCGYCTFAKAPAHLVSPYLTKSQILEICERGVKAGCSEALFTLGERPELRYKAARDWLADNDATSTVDYLVTACRYVSTETGLLPHSNAGALSFDELSLLREVSVSQGMMLESLVEDLAAHKGAPDKLPSRRLETLRDAGKLAIPFTTGILVGIGETRLERLAALEKISEIHSEYGHVQEVIIQNFVPKPNTPMAHHPPCSLEELCWTISVARLILPSDIHLQAPPNLVEDLPALLQSGIDDWGGISPVTPDHVNPEKAWPALDRLKAVTESCGYTIAPRLTVYPEFATNPKKWIDPKLEPTLLASSDAEGLARDSFWFSGGSLTPVEIVTKEPDRSHRPDRTKGRVFEILEGVSLGQELGLDEIVGLFSARGPEVNAIASVADQLRRDSVGDDVSFVFNRNINYTNVCTFKCRFCAFSKGPLSLNLRGKPYLLDFDEITQRVVEAEQVGATEVCLQGGINPEFDGNYYLEVLRAIKRGSSRIHIHAFSALEVTEGAKRLGLSLTEYLTLLKDAGLKTLPGTAAEILDDEVRSVLCPDKINTEQWLEVHRCAHSLGLRSNITIMFGAVEHPQSWARHMLVTRELQRETAGFTEFVPLPFVHMATPIFLQGRARRGPTFREAVLMHSIARIVYHGLIDNIQVSWVKMGKVGARQVLQAGANDLGGTLIDENISRAAGALHGQRMDRAELLDLLEPLGRNLVQRSTLYQVIDDSTITGPNQDLLQTPVHDLVQIPVQDLVQAPPRIPVRLVDRAKV